MIHNQVRTFHYNFALHVGGFSKWAVKEERSTKKIVEIAKLNINYSIQEKYRVGDFIEIFTESSNKPELAKITNIEFPWKDRVFPLYIKIDWYGEDRKRLFSEKNKISVLSIIRNVSRAPESL